MAHSWHRNVVATLACTILATTTGCTTERVDGSTYIYSFALWIPSVVLLGGIVGFVVGLIVRSWSQKLGWALIILGPLASVVVAPGMFLDKVTVNDTEFTLHTGFWFAPTVHRVKFGDLAQIDLTKEQRTSRRGTSTSLYMVCCHKTGANNKVPVGDLMKHGPAAKILEIARSQSVPINDYW